MLLFERMNSDFTLSNLRTAVAAAAAVSAFDVFGTGLVNPTNGTSSSVNTNSNSVSSVITASASTIDSPNHVTSEQNSRLALHSPPCTDRLQTDSSRPIGVSLMRAHNLPSDTFRALLDADYGVEMAEKENMRARFIPFVEYTDTSELIDGLRNGSVIGGKLEQSSNEKNGSSLRHEQPVHLDADGVYQCKGEYESISVRKMIYVYRRFYHGFVIGAEI
ncbi:hypothetical protein D915_003550 [Fasciola hepatica]|uniref:Uncharacterized protein n=1 Tax=Fasciola hepatica TaxID=6192 RepID=A0A4E0RGT8_FASHE|nr:hypothetical protein D915_003550 [Fasciola hepatica]